MHFGINLWKCYHIVGNFRGWEFPGFVAILWNLWAWPFCGTSTQVFSTKVFFQSISEVFSHESFLLFDILKKLPTELPLNTGTVQPDLFSVSHDHAELLIEWLFCATKARCSMPMVLQVSSTETATRLCSVTHKWLVLGWWMMYFLSVMLHFATI